MQIAYNMGSEILNLGLTQSSQAILILIHIFLIEHLLYMKQKSNVIFCDF
jgi:hypothetical protein